jgi:hypothetical protein
MTPVLGPGILAVSGAAIQEPVVADPPLPGGVAALLRFFFNLPQWIQIGGAVVGAIVAVALLVLLWRRRAAVRAWLATRSRPMKLALGGAAGVALLIAAVGGLYGYNYIQHDNGFCTGCHVMGPSYQRFTQSEHAQLQCHDCHQQSMFASMRQLYLWVAERPVEIGHHAPVATRVCAQCHASGNNEKWQRIATTAGHRTHLESDSSALRGVQCVTCHGVEVHRFIPADSTCGGCHQETEIKLAGMRNQTALHCATCHQFTADVPLLATRDSAAGTLTPGSRQCFSCHAMREQLASFDLSRDPHNGACGMCHNPHTQERPAAARLTCTNSGCHADWRGEPFHLGAAHRGVATQCLTCHQPHQAKVDAANCEGCHRAVRDRSGRRPPVPFDTGGVTRGKGDARPFDEPPRPPAEPAAARMPADTFSHERHKALACVQCHDPTNPRSTLTFVPPRGCQQCHHRAEAQCETCHRPAEYGPQSAVLRVTVAQHAPRERAITFAHAAHSDLACARCHTTPVTLEPAPAVATCVSCHEDHHAARRQCDACHAGPDIARSHAQVAEPHQACDACHAPATVARLVPTRTLCLTCHSGKAEHNAPRECTTCHFQTSPDAYREHLRRSRPS